MTLYFATSAAQKGAQANAQASGGNAEEKKFTSGYNDKNPRSQREKIEKAKTVPPAKDLPGFTTANKITSSYINPPPVGLRPPRKGTSRLKVHIDSKNNFIFFE